MLLDNHQQQQQPAAAAPASGPREGDVTAIAAAPSATAEAELTVDEDETIEEPLVDGSAVEAALRAENGDAEDDDPTTLNEGDRQSPPSLAPEEEDEDDNVEAPVSPDGSASFFPSAGGAGALAGPTVYSAFDSSASSAARGSRRALLRKAILVRRRRLAAILDKRRSRRAASLHSGDEEGTGRSVSVASGSLSEPGKRLPTTWGTDRRQNQAQEDEGVGRPLPSAYDVETPRTEAAANARDADTSREYSGNSLQAGRTVAESDELAVTPSPAPRKSYPRGLPEQNELQAPRRTSPSETKDSAKPEYATFDGFQRQEDAIIRELEELREEKHRLFELFKNLLSRGAPNSVRGGCMSPARGGDDTWKRRRHVSGAAAAVDGCVPEDSRPASPSLVSVGGTDTDVEAANQRNDFPKRPHGRDIWREERRGDWSGGGRLVRRCSESPNWGSTAANDQLLPPPVRFHPNGGPPFRYPPPPPAPTGPARGRMFPKSRSARRAAARRFIYPPGGGGRPEAEGGFLDQRMSQSPPLPPAAMSSQSTPTSPAAGGRFPDRCNTGSFGGGLHLKRRRSPSPLPVSASHPPPKYPRSSAPPPGFSPYGGPGGGPGGNGPRFCGEPGPPHSPLGKQVGPYRGRSGAGGAGGSLDYLSNSAIHGHHGFGRGGGGPPGGHPGSGGLAVGGGRTPGGPQWAAGMPPSSRPSPFPPGGRRGGGGGGGAGGHRRCGSGRFP